LNIKDDVESRVATAKVTFKADTKKYLIAGKDEAQTDTRTNNQVEDRAWRSKFFRYIQSNYYNLVSQNLSCMFSQTYAGIVSQNY
jgi:hypothetical protein